MNPKQRVSKKNNSGRRLVFFIIITVLIVGLVYSFSSGDDLDEIAVSKVIQQVNDQVANPPADGQLPAGHVSKLEINGAQVKVWRDGQKDPTQVAYRDTAGTLEEQGLSTDVVGSSSAPEIHYKDASRGGLAWASLVVSFMVPIVILIFLFMIIKSAQGQGAQALGFGRSKARLYGNEKSRITFADIAGNGNAKEDLEEVVDFLKNPVKFKNVKAKIPKGVLLVGPPGTGKTMIARAVAGEAKVPFYSISGSEFVEMFVGVGASRVRDLFAKAKKNSPCIIFVDEIDAVGRRRGAGLGGGHDEREQTLNQILVEMDGFDQGENVIVLAATNRADVLDPALLRPGRFDRRVNISLPDRRDRLAILKIHFKEKPVDSDVDLESLAVKTIGSSGADLSNIANESAIRAGRHNRRKIKNEDVVEAFERLKIGPARKNKVLDEQEREMTAYHESGHAIVGHVLTYADDIHKVTIVSRGHSGGATWSMPKKDSSSYSTTILQYKDQMAMMLGGRMAEKVIYGSEMVTTGAFNDLQVATQAAREMVTKMGMGSAELRHQVFPNNDGLMFDKIVNDRLYSEKTADRIDQEVRRLIREAANRAEIVIRDNLDSIERLKDVLLDKETVEADEVKVIFAKSRLPHRVKLLANPQTAAA